VRGLLRVGDKDIGGLDVSMDDALGVRCVKRVANLNAKRQNQLGFHRSPSDAVLQRQAIQKLHSDERFAVLVVNFVDRANIRVVQCRGSFGLALKAAEGLRVFGYVVRQEFEGDKTPELHILGLVDHTHAPAAQLLDYAIVRDGLADHSRMRASGSLHLTEARPMTEPETRYQKYLARKRQKQANKTTQTEPRKAGSMASQIVLAANAPIHECLVPANLFERGIGNLVFSRSLPGGRTALAMFLLDVFCLEVKDTFFTVVGRDEL